MPRHRRHFLGPFRLPARPALAGPVLAGLVMTCALAACQPAGPYAGPRFPFAASYAAKTGGTPVLLADTAWWTGFQDPVLDHLVTLALADNLSLAAARERVTIARADSRSLPEMASLTPTLEARARDGSAGRRDEAEASLGLSWLLDPYGLRREQLKAAWARVEAADAEADAARLLVLFNLCNAYVDLRYYQRLLAVRQQELASRRQTEALARSLLENGRGTQFNLTRARARVADVQRQIPTLEARVRVQMNQIAVLAGRAPGNLAGSLGVDLAKGSHGQPQSKMPPDIGIPADLLRNRPDIRISERLYYAALADLGAARAALMPRLSLGGAITLTSVSGGASVRDAYFGPTLTLPALPNDSRRATVDSRLAAARLAHTTWKATVLEAILEVENALLQYQASRKARVAAERSLTLNRETQGMIAGLLTSGDATIDDLLDADQSVAEAAAALTDARRQQGLDYIALNIRLGSGSRIGTTPQIQAAVAAKP